MATAAKTGVKQNALPWQKRAADLCTVARSPLALALVWLGIVRGRDGIQLTFVLLLTAVTLDTLDGYFARLAPSSQQTWIGAHDLHFDVAFSAGLLFNLAAAGYLSPYLAALYGAFWLLIWGRQGMLSNTQGVLFQAPIYAAVLLVVLLHHAPLILWAVPWAAVMLALAGKRFFRVRVPGFFADLLGKTPRD